MSDTHFHLYMWPCGSGGPPRCRFAPEVASSAPPSSMGLRRPLHPAARCGGPFLNGPPLAASPCCNAVPVREPHARISQRRLPTSGSHAPRATTMLPRFHQVTGPAG
ncbi:hypothetical protein PAHAL_9G569400 [Panicum hallii]|uniref:Uncharacterized protein n=1 Tax=Panicum hallii TaxID=206008 RepID=A0A2T8I618_9POAL|nr:hypothetical protein PAHAL_9G569400 [Panicum hallii]